MSKVTASHILIKYQGSRRPESFRAGSSERIRNTTLEEAFEQVHAWRATIVSGKYTFEQVAQHISDCGSAQNGGSLGEFGRGAMQKAFEDVAFGLQVGEISEPFVSDSGVHIVKRLA